MFIAHALPRWFRQRLQFLDRRTLRRVSLRRTRFGEFERLECRVVLSGAGPDLSTNTLALTGSISPTFYAPTSFLGTGQPITLTATPGRDLGGATPTGTVEFVDGTTPLGTQPVVNGVATFTVSSLPAGGDSIIANYSGDGNYAATESPALSETVSSSVVESGTGGNKVTVSGDLSSNTYVINYASGNLLSVNFNGSQFIFDPLVVTDVAVVGANGGNDTAVVYGTAGADAFTLLRGKVSMSGTNTQNVAVSVNATGITTGIVDGNGGNDTTIMLTSSIDDVFVGAPGTSASAANYAALYAFSGAFGSYAYHTKVTAVDTGGTETHVALLFTSQADDNTVGVPTTLEMAGAGFGGAGAFDYIAQDYPAANGYNAPGNTGTHTATFISSTSDDLFVASSNQFAQSASASTSSLTFNNVVYHYDSVTAINTDKTSTHTSFLYSSANNDTFTASPTSATLVGTTAGAVYNFTVNGFSSVSAFDEGTAGIAQLTGTADDDIFVGTSTFAQMTNGAKGDTVYKNTAYNFSTVTATTAPDSTASMATLIDDTNGNNTFTGNGATGSLLQNMVVNFAAINVYKTAPNTGTDNALNTNLDYIFREFGNWSS